MYDEIVFTFFTGQSLAPQDYTATTEALTFTAGGPTTLTISVPTAQDMTVEGNENFVGVLTLSPGNLDGILLGLNRATAIIQDDDSKLKFPLETACYCLQVKGECEQACGCGYGCGCGCGCFRS